MLRFTAPGWRPQSPLSLVALRAAVLRLLGPPAGDRVLEIGCGAGTLSLPLARQSRDLLGIDLERASVEDAVHNARALSNARFRVGCFADDKTHCYDLMINLKDTDTLPEFIQKALHYLQIINTNERKNTI